MADKTAAAPTKFIPREHVIRVLAAFAEVDELSNGWVRIFKADVIEEQSFFHDTMLVASTTRLARRLGIPCEFFVDPHQFEEYLRVRDTETAPFPLERRSANAPKK